MWLFIYLFSSLLLASFYILNRFKTNGTCLLYCFWVVLPFLSYYAGDLIASKLKTTCSLVMKDGAYVRTICLNNDGRENRMMVVVASSCIPSSSWNPICSNRFLPARRRRPGSRNYSMPKENSTAALQLLYSRAERYPNLEFSSNDFLNNIVLSNCRCYYYSEDSFGKGIPWWESCLPRRV